jgi:predicted O-linked N-acetylglucosamine transferase (SPINDLY family)
VITRAGQTHVSRVGVSLVSAIKLSDLVADADEQFVTTAVSLASKGSELTALRSGLRGRMQASLLRDANGFTRRFEAALRTSWKAKVLL